MKTMKSKIAILIALVMFATVGLVACGGGSQQACADEITGHIVLIKTSPSSGGGGAKSSGGGTKSSGGSSKSSGSGSKSGGSGSKSPSAPKAGTPKSASQNNASKTSSPRSKPSSSDVSAAKSSAPKTVSRSGSYYSSVTGNTYIYHGGSGYDFGYYRSPGYILDIFDPYNPYNYWLYASSPFYGRPYMLAGQCGQDAQEVQKENITINVDQDGKVVSATDPSAPTTSTTKNPQTLGTNPPADPNIESFTDTP